MFDDERERKSREINGEDLYSVYKLIFTFIFELLIFCACLSFSLFESLSHAGHFQLPLPALIFFAVHTWS